jgi:hypothetical protein
MRFSRSTTKTVTIFLDSQFCLAYFPTFATALLLFLCTLLWQPYIYASSHVPSTHALPTRSFQPYVLTGEHGLAFNLNFTKEARQRESPNWLVRVIVYIYKQRQQCIRSWITTRSSSTLRKVGGLAGLDEWVCRNYSIRTHQQVSTKHRGTVYGLYPP